MDEKTREYLTQRQRALASDQDAFEAELSDYRAGDKPRHYHFNRDELKRLIAETQARRNELGLMVTCFKIDAVHEAELEREIAQARKDTASRG